MRKCTYFLRRYLTLLTSSGTVLQLWTVPKIILGNFEGQFLIWNFGLSKNFVSLKWDKIKISMYVPFCKHDENHSTIKSDQDWNYEFFLKKRFKDWLELGHCTRNDSLDIKNILSCNGIITNCMLLCTHACCTACPSCNSCIVYQWWITDETNVWLVLHHNQVHILPKVVKYSLTSENIFD